MDQQRQLQPFPSLYSPFLHFFICQPFIDSLPSPSLRSPSLTTLPSSYLTLLLPFTVPSVVPSQPSSFPINLPLSLSTFLFPSQPSSFPINLPLSLSTFLFPSQPSSLRLNLPLSHSTFLLPSQPSPFPPNLPLPYFFLPYLSLSLPIFFPTYLLPYLSTSLPSLSLLPNPPLFPLFLHISPFFFFFFPLFFSLPFFLESNSIDNFINIQIEKTNI